MEPYYVLENSDGTSKVVHAGEEITEVANFNTGDEASNIADALNESSVNAANQRWLDEQRQKLDK